MALSVNITISMPPETVERIDAARGNWSRSRYIREAIRSCDGSPFESGDQLPDFSEEQTAGGVA